MVELDWVYGYPDPKSDSWVEILKYIYIYIYIHIIYIYIYIMCMYMYMCDRSKVRKIWDQTS